MAPSQPSLFGPRPTLPEGFAYRPDLITPDEEMALVANLANLPFKPFEFRGYLGKRRVAYFGWRYDFNAQVLGPAEPIPPFLLPLRERAANFAGLSADDFAHVLVTEYEPGAGIGWHRDRPDFAEVVGVSLLTPCLFRMRRKAGAGWDRASLKVEARSAYVLRGPARTVWEHSIPPIDRLRYSITFRRLKP